MGWEVTGATSDSITGIPLQTGLHLKAFEASNLLYPVLIAMFLSLLITELRNYGVV